LAATSFVLAEGGYGHLTIDRVAARARVARGSILRRWPSKVDLVLELLAGFGVTVPTPDTGNVLTDLLLFFQSYIDGVPTPAGRILPSLVAESFNDPELATAIHDVYILERRKRGAVIFERAIARGELRPSIDPGLAVDMIAGLVWHRKFVTGLELDIATARRFIDILLDGIAPYSSGGSSAAG
jgi:AcrR family transcriptional regulator